MLIATGKIAEYQTTLTISGSEAVKELNSFYISNWVEGTDNYRKGRGSASTKIYTACLKEPTTLTFSVAASTALTNLNAVGKLSIYKFK